MGLLQLGKVNLDGTKIQANASKHKAMSWAYANKLETQLRADLAELFEAVARVKHMWILLIGNVEWMLRYDRKMEPGWRAAQGVDLCIG